MPAYTFHRVHEGRPVFYTVHLKDDADAIANAKNNEGTTLVRSFRGEIVWKKWEPQEEKK